MITISRIGNPRTGELSLALPDPQYNELVSRLDATSLTGNAPSAGALSPYLVRSAADASAERNAPQSDILMAQQPHASLASFQDQAEVTDLRQAIEPDQVPAVPLTTAAPPSLGETLDSLLPQTTSIRDLEDRLTAISQRIAERPPASTPVDAALPMAPMAPRDSLSPEIETRLEQMGRDMTVLQDQFERNVTVLQQQVERNMTVLQQQVEDLRRTTARTDNQADRAREVADRGLNTAQESVQLLRELERSIVNAHHMADGRYQQDQRGLSEAIRKTMVDLDQVLNYMRNLEQSLVLSHQYAIDSRQQEESHFRTLVQE